MSISVKVNDITKEVVLHESSCHEVRKRGGVGKYNQVHWDDFDSLQEAELHALEWINAGYSKKYCAKCRDRFVHNVAG